MFGLRTHLARRLLLYVTSSVVGATFIIIVTQFLALQPMLEHTRARTVEATVENLSSIISQALWNFDTETAHDAAAAMLRDQFISGIVVNDLNQTFEFRGGDLSDTTHINPRTDSLVKIEDEESLVLIVPLIANTGIHQRATDNVGTLQVRSDNRLIRQQVNDLVKVTLVSTVVIIILLQGVFYLIIQRMVARPLERVTHHVQTYASNLDDTEFSQNSPLDSRQDEIGRLFNTFNKQHAELIDRDLSLRQHREQLEQTVRERTTELRETNSTLVDSLDQLKKAQAELIQNEKLVSLGTLVSGIAHEVNTPLGISITASSHMAEELRQTRKRLEENKLTKSGLENFMSELAETEELLSGNLNRAAILIQSFKKVAVDQSSDEERVIDMRSYVDEILLSLRPKLKHTQIHVSNLVEANIEISIAPGAVAQILTNLIMNSIIHGFDQGSIEGNITISAQMNQKEIQLVYQDDGAGMDEQTLKRIYDPFFTTRRSDGGSGLGMNIVYNLVTSKLNGYIDTESQPGKGLKVYITFAI